MNKHTGANVKCPVNCFDRCHGFHKAYDTLHFCQFFLFFL